MMNIYKPSDEMSLSNLFTRMSEYQASGCLQIVSGASVWLFFLRQGKLLYASSSIDPFGRLNRHIRRLSIQIPTLVSAVRVQLRLLFDSPSLESGMPANLPTNSATGGMTHSPTAVTALASSRDYRAICWLVEQRHLAPRQAASLIEDLAKEVTGMVLSVPIDRYELIEQDLTEAPQFCDLDLKSLVAQCQAQPLQNRVAEPTVQPFHSKSLGRTAPVDRYAAPAPEVVSSPPAAPQNPSSVAKPAHTIACIDDSPSILNAITNFLSDKGVSVIPINDPVKALMQIIRSKPDLILLDVTMPNLDGYELCSLLRKHPHFKNTPVVMVTSNTGFIDRAKAKLVGASGYMTKPFTETDLMKMVFKHLS
jgi:two-component system, chemotaxis family, response regulator PixG